LCSWVELKLERTQLALAHTEKILAEQKGKNSKVAGVRARGRIATAKLDVPRKRRRVAMSAREGPPTKFGMWALPI